MPAESLGVVLVFRIVLAALVLAVAFAASTAFMSPVGYQANLFVYGAGDCDFVDYAGVGAPLQVLLAVVTPLGIVLLWASEASVASDGDRRSSSSAAADVGYWNMLGVLGWGPSCCWYCWSCSAIRRFCAWISSACSRSSSVSTSKSTSGSSASSMTARAAAGSGM